MLLEVEHRGSQGSAPQVWLPPPTPFVSLQDPCCLGWGLSGCLGAPDTPLPRDDHIGALLAMRGDATRDMRQTIIETLEQGPAQASPDHVPIFRDIVVPSLNVAKLLK